MLNAKKIEFLLSSTISQPWGIKILKMLKFLQFQGEIKPSKPS